MMMVSSPEPRYRVGWSDEVVAMSTLFERQLAIYATYHRDARNRATHFIGIPAIVISLMPVLALWSVPLGGAVVSGAWIVAILAAIGWIALDRSIGIAMAIALVPMVLFGEWVATIGVAAAWWTFAILFVGGWVFQIVGHAAFEGRRPALLDNLFQAFIGPMFIMAETLMAFGLRRDLEGAITAEAIIR
jgi:uncharacterized membrane protein YGL010W